MFSVSRTSSGRLQVHLFKTLRVVHQQFRNCRFESLSMRTFPVHPVGDKVAMDDLIFSELQDVQ